MVRSCGRLAVILLFLFASAAEARMSIITLGSTNIDGAPAGCSGNCPIGTYSFYWDGDHVTAEDYACTGDCATSFDAQGSDGTDRIVTTNIEGNASGKFFKDADNPTPPNIAPNAEDQYVYWRAAADALCDDTEGTIWISVQKEATDDDTMILEIISNPYSGNNRIMLYYRSNTEIRGYHYGNGTAAFLDPAATVLVDGVWNRVGYTWKTSADSHCTRVIHNYCSVTTGTNCSQNSDCPGGETCTGEHDTGWSCEADVLDDWAAGSQPTDVWVGCQATCDAEETDITTYIDNLVIVSGAGTYQTADPF